MSVIDLDTITLAKGGHTSRADGVCIMELAAWVAGRPHSDRPPCVSPVIASFLRQWNDSMDDTDRQMLKPYAALVLNTNTGAADETARAWMLTDWLARECAPAWLRLAGLKEQAQLLEALAPLTGMDAARAAQPCLDEARTKSAAAGAAAWAAAWDAARAAARAAAGAAARAALRQTTTGLQPSALLLLDRMIAVGKTEAVAS